MREVVIVAIAATVGNVLVGWDSSTIAGVYYIYSYFIKDFLVYFHFVIQSSHILLVFLKIIYKIISNRIIVLKS